MARTKLVAGNWKMHKTPAETRTFCKTLADAWKPSPGVDVAIFPPFVCLAAAAEGLAGSAIGLGAQNLHPAESGAFTGEVSANMLLTLGCQYVIIGHSERRALFAESDEFICEKVLAAQRAGLRPLLCVGEQLAEREAGETDQVVARQLSAVIDRLDTPDRLAIAYEPVWAIGTGKTATPGQAQDVHAFIRARLLDRFGDQGAGPAILYGGSVKPDNAKELMSQKNVDGALVGGASLTVNAFAAIIEAAV